MTQNKQQNGIENSIECTIYIYISKYIKTQYNYKDQTTLGIVPWVEGKGALVSLIQKGVLEEAEELQGQKTSAASSPGVRRTLPV